MPRKYVVNLLPAAKRDLLEIFTYIALDSRENALKYLKRIEEKISLLSVHPKMGKVPFDNYLAKRGYRILVIDAYLVFYVIQGNSVKLRRILHGSRDLKAILFP